MKTSIALLLTLVACGPINRSVGLPDENPIEEAVEQIFKNKTGVDIDLTPLSEEPEYVWERKVVPKPIPLPKTEWV